MTDSSSGLPIVDAEEIPATDGRGERIVEGVVLAAGTSSRFGEENKLLATVNGEPLVRRAVRTLLSSQVDRTFVVVGYEADRVRTAVEDLDVTVLDNDAYENGQATSVRTAVESIRGDAAVFALGDMPYVASETVDALLDAYEAGVGDALAAAYDGQRGNPVLFDRQHFPRLANLSGDTGGRDVLMGASSGALIAVDDPGAVTDVDTPDALDGSAESDHR